MPRLNFNDIPDAKEFKMIPSGEYLCKIEGVEETKSSKRNPMWKLILRILEGEYVGQCIFDNLVFSGKALPRVKLLAKAVGFSTDNDEDVEFTPSAIQGKHVRVATKIEVSEYEGAEQKRTKVEFAGYGSPDGGPIRDGEYPEPEKKVNEDDPPF